MKSLLSIVAVLALSAVASAQRCNVSSAQASASSAADVQNQALASVLAQLQAQNAASAARVATATAQAARTATVFAQSVPVAPLVIVPPQGATVATASSVGGGSASVSNGRRHPIANAAAALRPKKRVVAKSVVRADGSVQALTRG